MRKVCRQYANVFVVYFEKEKKGDALQVTLPAKVREGRGGGDFLPANLPLPRVYSPLCLHKVD